MHTFNLLDVSLRDGGHRTNFHFSHTQLRNILTPLDNSGIDYVEVGYRNGSLHPIANLGRAGFCDREYLDDCHSLLKHAKMAVMAHPKHINEQDIIDLQAHGVQLLRLCVSKGHLNEALPAIGFAKRHYLPVSVNFIHLSYYSDAELTKVVAEVAPYQPDMIYFADSNGSLLPDRIHSIYKTYLSRYAIPFGFHAHDNLGLAQANALAAMDAGVPFIDASLAGMGKGTGNLKTEFFTAWLHAINHKQYDLKAIVKAANYVRDTLGIGCEALSMDEFTRGITDLSTADLKAFKETLG